MSRITLSFLFSLICHAILAQGCVAIRNLTGFGQFITPGYDEESVKWLVNANTRYFKSYQDFNGNVNQHVADEDQKVNHVYVVDFAVTRMLNNGWSITVDLPFSAADRTSWQEHGNDPQNKIKYSTQSFGLGDIRLTAYKWILDVSTYHRGNIQVGVGVKLATGDYAYRDYFHKPTGLELLPVNQSIQLGDGGTGLSLELNAFYTVSKRIALYGNGFYLLNPRDLNGTYSLAPMTAENIQSTLTINSVPDAYTIRGGANFNFDKLVLWSGLRMEGQPVHDLIGSSNGNRRPGRIISFEPGMNYRLKGSTTIYLFVPLPIYRTTYQCVPDQRLDTLNASKAPHFSTGGFADYMIFIGTVFKL